MRNTPLKNITFKKKKKKKKNILYEFSEMQLSKMKIFELHFPYFFINIKYFIINYILINKHFKKFFF